MNIKKATMIAAAIGLTSAMSVPALAQFADDTTHADAPEFEAIDKNEDGVIGLDEAKGTWLERSFAQVDVNGDGYVSRSEYDSAIS